MLIEGFWMNFLLKGFGVGGSEEVNQFMHDYELSQIFGHGQELGSSVNQLERVSLPKA